MELNLEGVVVGAASLLVTGAFHPLVIWCEYRFTQRIWPVFLIAGLLCLLAALLIQGILSILLGLLGAGCLWSIRELKEQANKVFDGLGISLSAAVNAFLKAVVREQGIPFDMRLETRQRKEA